MNETDGATPRVDALLDNYKPNGQGQKFPDSELRLEAIRLARQLERELAAVTLDRDELAREMKRHFPISRFNGLDIGQWKDRAEQAEARVKELEDRLEISHAYDADGNKVPFPKGAPDGIACRDMTIRLLEERAEEAERDAGRLRMLALLLSSAWYYGAWKAETANERDMEALMRQLEYWPVNNEGALCAAIDKAMEAGRA